MVKQYAIIVAGGKGSRLNSEIPKQFLLIDGKPVLWYSIVAFYNYSSEIEINVILPEEQIDYWKTLCKEHNLQIEHNIVIGGKTRYHSVRNGLKKVKGNGYVAIHDGARPVVSPELIESCFDAAEKQGNALPVIKINDSMRRIEKDDNKPIDRSVLRICQTPQVFRCEEIKNAYKQPYMKEFTDDASVLEFSGHKIYTIPGLQTNIKITTDTDLLFAEILLKDRSGD